MSIIGCAGSDEGPGANFTPPTLGDFMKKQQDEQKLLRESRAGSQVAHEARKFHEKQALRYGLHTNRGLAHFHASKVYSSTREGNRLQEMFENGGQLGELPPKAIIKANKAAMKFHKGQAEKAGLDSDLGHAHVAAMEHHADILKKAKQQHAQQTQQQPMKAGGPGSGPKRGEYEQARRDEKDKELDKKELTPENYKKKYGQYVDNAGKPSRRPVLPNKNAEALPGHGSKKSPVPVPKKSQMPNGDVHDPSKPPVNLNPEDANQPLRKLQQKRAAKREANIRNFGKESNAQDHVDDNMKRTFPKGAGRQVKRYLVHRDPRTKEARRRRHL